MRRVGSFASRRAGFSLAELFVVTAIIGVMAAMLLPSLARAREKSRRTICVAHLRQIGQVTTMYHDVYRALPTEDFSGYLMWDGVDYLLNGQVVRVGGPHLARIYFCPSSPLFEVDDAETGMQNFGVPGQITASTYELRGLAQGGPRTLDGHRLAWMADLAGSARNHADGLTVLHTDGAVQFMTAPAGWTLAASNAWSQLDQEMVAGGP